MKKFVFCLILVVGLPAEMQAETSAFTTGPLIDDFGPHAEVHSDWEIADGAEFRVSFDIATQAEPGAINRGFETAARFLNMHVAAGVPAEQIRLTLVVHGSASKDLLNAQSYQDRFETSSANVVLLESLLANNVEFVLCGQSAAFHSVDKRDLVSGVRMALSAMTAHALLQQSGYTLNPF